MPPAARIGDFHACPAVCPPPAPHVGGPIVAGSGDVFINGIPAARVGDSAVCACASDSIAAGSGTVMINGKPSARIGDSCAHGGAVAAGSPTVIIG